MGSGCRRCSCHGGAAGEGAEAEQSSSSLARVEVGLVLARQRTQEWHEVVGDGARGAAGGEHRAHRCPGRGEGCWQGGGYPNLPLSPTASEVGLRAT